MRFPRYALELANTRLQPLSTRSPDPVLPPYLLVVCTRLSPVEGFDGAESNHQLVVMLRVPGRGAVSCRISLGPVGRIPCCVSYGLSIGKGKRVHRAAAQRIGLVQAPSASSCRCRSSSVYPPADPVCRASLMFREVDS